MKRFPLLWRENHILKKEGQLPQKCSVCIQSTKLNCSSSTAAPPGTALVQGYKFQRTTNGWPVLLVRVAKAPEQLQQLPNQSHKGAEKPESHLLFQLPSVKSAYCPPLTLLSRQNMFLGKSQHGQKFWPSLNKDICVCILTQNTSILFIQEGKQ